MLERFESCGIHVMMIDRIEQAVEKLLLPSNISEKEAENLSAPAVPLIASSSGR